jgi:hypothetical protein
MTERAKRGRGTDHTEHAGADAKPICRRLFTIAQAADGAGVPVQVICSLINSCKLEAYVLAGGVRIDGVELADLLVSDHA